MTHAGMVPVFSGTDETSPGTYEVELEFMMMGDWVVIVTTHMGDGRSLESHFEVRGVKAPR